MYPQPELTRLADCKAALQRNIAVRRAHCAKAAARAARPLDWLDRVRTFGRKLSPFAQLAAVPLGFLLTRTLFSRRKSLGSLIRWGPLVFSAACSLRSAVRPRR
ncbi:MAG: hypothetical protein ABSE59_05300 [Opitutaceae bacterium]|jgi:hypothetical protein